MALLDATAEATQRIALRRARRQAARMAASDGDGLMFLSSQEGQIATDNASEDVLGTIAARNKVGEKFLKFLGDRPFSIDHLKTFLRVDLDSYAATSMWTRRSHLLTFIQSEFWVEIRQEQLTCIDSLIKKKMDKHVKKKASAFTTEEIMAYLRTADDTPVNVRNKLILLFGTFSLGRMAEITYLNWEDISEDDANHAYNFVLKRCKSRGKDVKEQSFFVPFTVYGYDVLSVGKASKEW